MVQAGEAPRPDGSRTDAATSSAPRETTSYPALVRQLRALVHQAEGGGDHRLPTEAELVERYRVSRQTVRRAMQELVVEGLVYRVAGRGTFAIPRHERYLRYFGSVEDLMALSVDTELRLHSPLQRRIDVESAGRLNLPVDTVATVGFARLNDGVPFNYSYVRMPTDVGQLIEDVPELTTMGVPGRTTILGLLDQRLEERIVEADQSISAAPLPAVAADALGAPEGAMVLRIDRLYSTANRPVELSTAWFLPDLYSYRIRLRRT